MKINKATRQYEKCWERLPLIESDLVYKHERMTEGLFEFMRATFYRWIQLWPEHCSKLAKHQKYFPSAISIQITSERGAMSRDGWLGNQ